MKRIIFGTGALLLTVILFFKLNLPLKEAVVIGTYVSNEAKPFLAEVPHKSDTLILKLDGTFISGFYGTGTYNLNCGILTTEIAWTYKYEMGNARHSAYFSNKIYENPKIILNDDADHYYEKIN